MKIHTSVVVFSATRLMMMMIMSSGVLLDWDSHNYDFDDYVFFDDFDNYDDVSRWLAGWRLS